MVGAQDDDSEPLHFLVGTTASGKTELALEVAERAGAEVLSMDSMLVYRGMDVGTAKPGPAERARVPHHLLDRVAPSERYDTRRWIADARAALADVRARGRRALFVGGTALYLKALTHGLFDGPDPDPALRAELRRAAAGDPAAAHARLSAVDRASAARIHPHDVKRVVRALEVWEQTGRPLSDWQREWRAAPGSAPPAGRPRRVVGLAVPVAELDRRIPRRTRAMLDAGWADEVRAILADGGFGDTASQALGYPQVRCWIEGELDRGACEAEIALRTRQFARRQRTWFRKSSEIRWVEAASPLEERVTVTLEALGWA